MGDGPPGFPQDFSCPMVLGCLFERVRSTFVYRTSTFYGQTFQTVRLVVAFVTLRPSQHSGQNRSRYPRCTTHAGLHAAGFRLFPFRSPLLRKSNFLLFLGLLRWLSSPRWRDVDYVFIDAQHGFTVLGSPIRTSPGQRSCAPNRSFSQLTTSFIAYRRQGIRHAPLVTLLKYLRIDTALLPCRLSKIVSGHYQRIP